MNILTSRIAIAASVFAVSIIADPANDTLRALIGSTPASAQSPADNPNGIPQTDPRSMSAEQRRRYEAEQRRAAEEAQSRGGRQSDEEAAQRRAQEQQRQQEAREERRRRQMEAAEREARQREAQQQRQAEEERRRREARQERQRRQQQAAEQAERERQQQQRRARQREEQQRQAEEERRRREARRERRDDRGNNRGTVIDLGIPGVGGRVIIREDGDIRVRADDGRRFGRGSADSRTVTLPNGRTRTMVDRANGVRVITTRDRDGNVIRRVRREANGREIVLIDDDRAGQRRRPVSRDPIRLPIPRDQYIVESDHADRRAIARTLQAPPVVSIDRAYTLEEVRNEPNLRAVMRRVDLNTITFATGSAAIQRSQLYALDSIGAVMASIIDANPAELFLIEGHTDAVGDEISNLALSDARAESVAIALTDYYGIPPENIVTQGYGESELKVYTLSAERANRRVAVRRITSLISGGR